MPPALILLGLGALGLLALGGKKGGSAGINPANCPKLDPNLPTQTANAVCIALTNETNPGNLLAFSNILKKGNFPIASSMLTSKANIILLQLQTHPGMPLPGAHPPPGPSPPGPPPPPPPVQQPGAPQLPGGMLPPLPGGFPQVPSNPGFPQIPSAPGLIPGVHGVGHYRGWPYRRYY